MSSPDLAEDDATEPRVRLRLRPDDALVSSVREFVCDVLVRAVDDGDLVARVGLTVHELLENVVKYSLDGMVDLEVAVVGSPGQRWTQVQVENRLDSSHATRLCALVDELTNSANPMALYLQMLASSARLTTGSGLGLARIRAEGEMDLRYELAGDIVKIVAETAVH